MVFSLWASRAGRCKNRPVLEQDFETRSVSLTFFEGGGGFVNIKLKKIMNIQNRGALAPVRVANSASRLAFHLEGKDDYRVTNIHLPEDLHLVEDALKKGSFVEVLFAKGSYFVNRNRLKMKTYHDFMAPERTEWRGEIGGEPVYHFVLRNLREYQAEGQLIEQAL